METRNLINQKYGEINALKEYLSKTDYISKKAYESSLLNLENPFIAPSEILAERQAARDSINILEAEIVDLEATLKAEEESKEEIVNNTPIL